MKQLKDDSNWGNLSSFRPFSCNLKIYNFISKMKNNKPTTNVPLKGLKFANDSIFGTHALCTNQYCCTKRLHRLLKCN